MKWQIPAKTFLLGEYAALADHAAVIATTIPCFRLQKISEPVLKGIHPQSPAGQYWQKYAQDRYGLQFEDPWQGIGGLGASSAQFIGAWLAQQAYTDRSPDKAALLADYYQLAWDGKGLRPSAYDVMAQLSGGIFFCKRQAQTYCSGHWPLTNLNFLLVHSGQKVSTHHYLQEEKLPDCLPELGQYAENGWQALQEQNSEQFIESIKDANLCLQKTGLVALNSRNLISKFNALPSVRASKGCGAMGADVIAVFFEPRGLPFLKAFCFKNQLQILASSTDIYHLEKNIFP